MSMDFDKLRTLPPTTQEELDQINKDILALASGTENARDTHFKGFANLLMQEIDEQVGAVTKWGLEHDIDSQEKIGQELYSRWQTLIAQRAYDLACHTLRSTAYGLDRFYISDQVNDNVPDLTEWPEPDQGGTR